MRRALLVFTAVSSLLAGCLNAAAVTFGPSDAKVKLVWLANTGQSPRSTNAAVAKYYTDAVQAWLEKHPDVSIEMNQHATDINASMARLQEQVRAGRGPDFAAVDSFFLSRFYDQLQPLDAYVPADTLSDYVGFAAKGMKGPDGKLKALWINTDARVLWYRPDLVPQPPKTWDELIATASEISKAGNVGYLYPGGRGEASVMEHLPMFWAQGGALVDAAGKPVFGEGKNRDAMLNVLEFIKRTIDSGVSPPRVVNFGFESDMYPEIRRGNVAMFLGGSWMGKQLRDLGDKSDWAVAPIPMPAGAGQSTAVGGWTVGVFTPDAEKQKLIMDFANSVVAGEQSMADAVTAIGNLPTRKSVAELNTPYFQQPNIKAFLEMLSYGQARPGAAIYPVISSELQVAIANTITGTATPAEALDTAWSKVSAAAK